MLLDKHRKKGIGGHSRTVHKIPMFLLLIPHGNSGHLECRSIGEYPAFIHGHPCFGSCTGCISSRLWEPDTGYPDLFIMAFLYYLRGNTYYICPDLVLVRVHRYSPEHSFNRCLLRLPASSGLCGKWEGEKGTK